MKTITEKIYSNLNEGYREDENAESIAWDLSMQAGSECSEVLNEYSSELAEWLKSYQSTVVRKGNNATYDWFTLIQNFSKCVVKFKGEVPDKKNKSNIIFKIDDWKKFEDFAKGDNIE